MGLSIIHGASIRLWRSAARKVVVFPVAERGMAVQALTAGAPAAQRRHVGFDPGSVNKDETGRARCAADISATVPGGA